MLSVSLCACMMCVLWERVETSFGISMRLSVCLCVSLSVLILRWRVCALCFIYMSDYLVLIKGLCLCVCRQNFHCDPSVF